MHLLAGLDTPTSGSVLLGDTELTALGDDDADRRCAATRVGFVFQSFNLLPMFDAEQNILLPLDLAGPHARPGRGSTRSSRPSGLRPARPPPLASCPAVSSSGSRSPGRWSPSPRWSSPTSRPGTSTRARAPRCWASCGARRELGQTIVMVTHDPAAAAYADRVVLLADGRIAGESCSPPGVSAGRPRRSRAARRDGRGCRDDQDCCWPRCACSARRLLPAGLGDHARLGLRRPDPDRWQRPDHQRPQPGHRPTGPCRPRGDLSGGPRWDSTPWPAPARPRGSPTRIRCCQPWLSSSVGPRPSTSSFMASPATRSCPRWSCPRVASPTDRASWRLPRRLPSAWASDSATS